VVKTEKVEDAVTERLPKKGKKKKERQKEPTERASLRSSIERRLLVLPFEASLIALVLLILLGGFYVV